MINPRELSNHPADANLDRIFAHEVLGLEDGAVPEFSRDMDQLQPFLDAIESQSSRRIVSERLIHGWKTQIFDAGCAGPVATAEASERPLSVVRALLSATKGVPFDVGDLGLPSVPGF